MTRLIPPTYPPDELFTAITHKEGVDRPAFAKKQKNPIPGRRGLEETRNICVETTVVAPRPRLPQISRRNDLSACPTALYHARRLLLTEGSTGATFIRWSPLADYQYVRIIDIGTTTNSVATGTGRGSVHGRMEDSCARKKVIVITLNVRLFVGVMTTIEIPLPVLVLTDSLNHCIPPYGESRTLLVAPYCKSLR